jgi:hypothetical protein
MDITTLGLKVDSTPVEKATANLDKLAATGAKAEQSAQRIGASYSKAAREIQTQVASMLDQMQRMVAEQQRTNDILGQGKTAATQAAQALKIQQTAQAAVTTQTVAMNSALAQTTTQLAKTGTGATLTTQQMQGLTHSVRAFFDQVVAGGSPLKAGALEIGKLSGTFGSVGNAVEAVTGLLSPMRVALGLGVAAVVGLGLAYHQGAQETQAYNQAIVMSGNAAGTTTGQLQVMARTVAQTTGTAGQAADVLTLMVASGKIPQENLRQYATMAVGLERVGVEAKDTVADLAALGTNPVAASVKLNDSLNYLTASTYRQIKALEDLGRQQDAADLAQQAYSDAQSQRIPQMESQIGTLSKAWRFLTDAIKGAGDELKNIGRTPGLELQLAQVQDQLRAARGQDPNRPFATPFSPAASDLAEKERRLQRMLEIQRGSAAAQAQEAEAAKAASAFETLREQSLSRQERLQIEVTKAQNLGVTAGVKQVEIDKVIAGLSAEVSKLGIEAQIERLQGIQQVLEVRTKSTIDTIQARQRMGMMNDRVAMEQEFQVEANALGQRRALMEQQVALKAKERDSDKDVAAIKVQIAVLDAQRNALQVKHNADVAVMNDQLEKALTFAKMAMQQEFADSWAAEIKKNTDAFATAGMQVYQYQRAVKDANDQIDFEASLLGKSTHEQALANEQRRIALELQRQQRGIDDAPDLTAEEKAVLRERASKAATEAAAKASTSVWVKEWDEANKAVADGLYDELTGQGKSAADQLKRLFGNLVLRPIIQPIANMITNAIMGSPSGTGLFGSGSMSGGGGLLNNNGLIGAGYQFLTGSSAGASGASLVGANAVGMAGGDSLGALIAGNGGWAGVSTAGLGALGGVTSGVSVGGIGSGIASFGLVDTGAAALSAGIGGGVAAGGAGAAAAGAAAAIPVIGWAIAAAALLYSIFGQKKGGPKQDGRYGLLGSGVAKYDKDLSPQNNSAAQQAAQGLQAQYDSIVSAFGGTGGIHYGLGFSTDPKGTSPTFLDITGSRNGQVVSNDVNLNVGRSQQELQDAIAKMGASAVLKGLQQSNIDGIIGGYLAALGDVTTKSTDEITAALVRLQKAGAEKQRLDETWYHLTHTAAEIQARDRQNEINALDISNQAMQVRINALQDEIVAQQQVQQAYAQVTAAVGDMQKQINGYLDKLNATSAGMGSPETQLAAAQSQFQRQLALAQSGNGDAMQSITDYADQLIQAQVAYSASGPQTQATIAAVKASLGQLPSQLNPTDIIAKTFQDGAFLLNATLQELIAKADANSAAQIAAITQKAADQNAALAAAAAADEASKAAAAVTAAASHWGGVLGSGSLTITVGGGGPMAASGQTAGGTTPFGAVPGIDPSLFGSQYGYSSYGGGAADGGVFTGSGGLVNGTTPFLSATGKLHVMGEAGAEAVMPLVRTSSGSLGVRAVGSAGSSNDEVPKLLAMVIARLESLLTVNAAGARGTIDGIKAVAEYTALAARKATLDAARKPA